MKFLTLHLSLLEEDESLIPDCLIELCLGSFTERSMNYDLHYECT